MSNLDELSNLPPKPIWDGVLARAVTGDRLALSVVELEPNALVPEHRHDNEQIGLVIEGTIRFTIDGETKDLGPGGTWCIGSNVPHEARAGDKGAVLIDVFAPPRADWEQIEDRPVQAPVWPAR
ncbi:MAG TPA: cupin domain-containing protein [Gaiellaceae bacterium]|jgi:quercetin dioxygenase-like cupin family protein